MSQEESKSYGAIPRGDAEDTAEFDEKNLSYLKESGFSWNRFCRAVLPIIIALLIMGGFAFGMGHGQVILCLSVLLLILAAYWLLTNKSCYLSSSNYAFALQLW
mmetsp:Transcript_21165/g.34916  ORF Transcript_21165/g.34916 Transcript_21165/m.34916 type:complete len:104 (+) Transcript_21165:96-407(+)